MLITRYKITLRTLGPVHIGSGVTLTKAEYIAYDSGKIDFINSRNLIHFLREKGLLNDYLNYMKYTKTDDVNLKEYLESKNIDQLDWVQFKDYHVPTLRDKEETVGTIDKFISDGRGNIYIPGSSLKGALRSVLTNHISDEEKENEILRKIRVIDSEPLDTKRMLTVYRKYDVGEAENVISNFKECIKPNQRIEMELLIEDNVIELEEIQARIKKYYRNLYDKHIAKFERTKAGARYFKIGYVTRPLEVVKDNQVIFLGGGVGFASKTYYYQHYDEKEAKELAFEVLKKHAADDYEQEEPLPITVPKVLKATNDTNAKPRKPFLFGPCEITIEKIGEY